MSPTLAPEAVLPRLLGSPAIHWREKILLVLLSLHLGFLPWALGAMHLWSQQLSVTMAGVAFLWAVVLNPPSTTIIPKIPAWRKLVRSPAVWIGLALLGYIATQALNPAYRYFDLAGEIWLLPLEHISWLPSGMETPLEQMSPFRHLIIFGSAFLTLVTILLFIERPKSVHILLGALTLNGVALAILTFAQFFTGAEEIFWKIPSESPGIYSSFVYRNHAASYLNLLLTLSLGLYFHFRERSWKTNDGAADKSPIFFFTSTILFTTVLFSGSRGGIIVASLILLLAIGYTLIQAWRWSRLREGSVISSVMLGLLILFASVFTAIIGPERIIERFKLFAEEDGGGSVRHRTTAAKATFDMFQDRPLWGWGAGSFEYAFPSYQENYPEIHYREFRNGRRIYMVWDYAHNDWVQYPAEYGLAGMGIFFTGMMAWLIGLYRFRAWRQPIPIWLAAGIFLTLAHGLGDFVLQNPATIITAAAAVALSLRSSWLETGRRRARREHRVPDDHGLELGSAR
jgi:O-antigen ligase